MTEEASSTGVCTNTGSSAINTNLTLNSAGVSTTVSSSPSSSNYFSFPSSLEGSLNVTPQSNPTKDIEASTSSPAAGEHLSSSSSSSSSSSNEFSGTSANMSAGGPKIDDEDIHTFDAEMDEIQKLQEITGQSYDRSGEPMMHHSINPSSVSLSSSAASARMREGRGNNMHNSSNNIGGGGGRGGEMNMHNSNIDNHMSHNDHHLHSHISPHELVNDGDDPQLHSMGVGEGSYESLGDDVFGGDGTESRSVYVGNVDYSSTPQDLQEHFKSCGQINRITIMVDKYSGHPKGFAYIEFGCEEAVQNAVLLNDTVFMGRQIKVNPKRKNLPGFSRARGFPRGRVGFRGAYRGRPRGMYRPYYRARGVRGFGRPY